MKRDFTIIETKLEEALNIIGENFSPIEKEAVKDFIEVGEYGLAY